MPVTQSPLRYPGGKTQLFKFVRNLIEINEIKHSTYIEPFAGGAGVALELLFSNSVENIVINDYD
ncbi:DNA adenine methylase, partial [Listeria monocytogenes]|nr:DNA adenine methylase [Listeria monocytogenes]